MTKLEELRQLVANAFNKSESKESIETLATINKAIEDVSKEQDELIASKAELLKDYKEVIKHTSFTPTNEDKSKNDITPKEISFEEALANFMSNNKGE